MTNILNFYGLLNLSKFERVSNNWINKPVSKFELNQIAKLLNWDLDNDIIYCGCYYLIYQYKNNNWHTINYIKYPINQQKITNLGIKYVCNDNCLEIKKEHFNNKIIL